MIWQVIVSLRSNRKNSFQLNLNDAHTKIFICFNEFHHWNVWGILCWVRIDQKINQSVWKRCHMHVVADLVHSISVWNLWSHEWFALLIHNKFIWIFKFSGPNLQRTMPTSNILWPIVWPKLYDSYHMAIANHGNKKFIKQS